MQKLGGQAMREKDPDKKRGLENASYFHAGTERMLEILGGSAKLLSSTTSN